MAYDSASETALNSQALQRALAIAQQKRERLNRGFGFNADGSLDNLGSIYQGNLGSVQDEHQAELADRRRGFGATTGGLGHKASAAAHDNSLNRQAVGLRDAADQLGQVSQEEGQAQQEYENQKTVISKRSDFDLTQTLLDNPLLGNAPAPETAVAANKGLPPSVIAARKIALKNNPRIAQTARNRF